eukprot:COSAG06_NODE_7329_length_2544_cov_8.932106_2_plen_73_part_00
MQTKNSMHNSVQYSTGYRLISQRAPQWPASPSIRRSLPAAFTSSSAWRVLAHAHAGRRTYASCSPVAFTSRT